MATGIKIHVQNPMMHTISDGKFTSYLIVIEADNLVFSLKSSNIRRRYSEFVWFRDTLAKHHPNITPPSLPPKTFFKDRFDPNLIEDRKLGLSAFLEGVVSVTRYLSDNAVHLFLQSPLSTRQIEHVLSSPNTHNISEIITTHGQEAQGICPDCNGQLYEPEESGASAIPPASLPVANAPAPTCPHDIFSPTRPHSFDFSHCIMGQSMSYDSSDEVIMSHERQDQK